MESGLPWRLIHPPKASLQLALAHASLSVTEAGWSVLLTP